MTEIEQPKEPQKPQGNPGAALETNGAFIPEDLEVIRAQLEEEKKAKASAEAELANRAKRIAELEASLNVVSQASEAAVAELSQTREAHAKAVSKYLEAARALNSTVPGNVIAGGTIEEIDASVEKAKAIAESVKKALEAQAKETKVPAGAPTRTAINLEGLSPREKIAAGLNQKGGTN